MIRVEISGVIYAESDEEADELLREMQTPARLAGTSSVFLHEKNRRSIDEADDR